MKELLNKYAELIIKVGVNLSEGQELVINSDVETAYFARIIAQCAYSNGAKRVTVLWHDDKLSKISYINESIDTITDIPDHFVSARDFVMDNKAAYVGILSEDPEIFSDVDSTKLAARSRAVHNRCKKFYDASMSNNIRWTLVAVPNDAWVHAVFPNEEKSVAVDRLWNMIFKAMRLDQPDPIDAWRKHQMRLESINEWLNSKNFRILKYHNSLGTDLTIGLPQGYYFSGGYEKDVTGIAFSANMPTEEVFTAPHRLSANGKVVASMPLFHHGKRIENFGFSLVEGRIVDYYAEIGYDVLKGIIDTDEGSHYLGEIALVQYDSPINNLKTLFRNTLFDENASCHLAIGGAYPMIEGAQSMSKEELLEKGINDSLEHVDFMIGTPDLSIVGIDDNGVETVIMKDGNFLC